MDSSYFKKCVGKTVDAKATKDGLRAVLRRKPDVVLAAAIVGMQVKADELLRDMRPYVLGEQLNPAMLAKAKDDLGDILHHAALAAKVLKVRVPPAQRKVRVKGTHLAILTDLETSIGEAMAEFYQAFQGVSPDKDKLKVSLGKAFDSLYMLSWAMLKVPAAEVMDEHVEKLKAGKPEGFFTFVKKPAPVHIQEKMKAKAAEAAKAAATKSTAKGTPGNPKLGTQKAGKLTPPAATAAPAIVPAGAKKPGPKKASAANVQK